MAGNVAGRAHPPPRAGRVVWSEKRQFARRRGEKAASRSDRALRVHKPDASGRLGEFRVEIVGSEPTHPQLEGLSAQPDLPSALPFGHAQPTRRRDEPVPPPARPQPGRLVPVGSGGARPGEGGGQADLPVDRLRRLPLVPRHGARELRGRGHGRRPEPGLRRDQGRSRGAAGSRPGLHGRRPGDDRPGRLADERLPDARRAPVLRRDLLSAAAAPRLAELPRRAGRGRPSMAGATARGRRGRPAARRDAGRPEPAPDRRAGTDRGAPRAHPSTPCRPASTR